MDDDLRKLKGAESRDLFKMMHKQTNRTHYACDIDFCFVSKVPPGIVAFVDFKKPWDRVTFSEVLAYNALLDIAPVFIIEAAEPESGPFTVKRYVSGDWKPEPPRVVYDNPIVCGDWTSLDVWEESIRKAYKARGGA